MTQTNVRNKNQPFRCNRVSFVGATCNWMEPERLTTKFFRLPNLTRGELSLLPFTDHPITNKILSLIHHLIGERRITEQDLNVLIDGFETDRYAFVAVALRSKGMGRDGISFASCLL